jgi:hypothetical protein
MKKTQTYRLAAYFLALLFGVYNVGIPIVLASCPMATVGPVCSGCFEPGVGKERVTTHKDTSCCATIIAADRNTNEFLQSKDLSVASLQMEAITILPADYAVVERAVSSISILSHSPPVQPDLPILHSALLI